MSEDEEEEVTVDDELVGDEEGEGLELIVADSSGYSTRDDWLETVELEAVGLAELVELDVTEGIDEELDEALLDPDVDIVVETPGGVYIEGRLKDEVEEDALLGDRTPPLDRDKELELGLDSEMVLDTL